MEQRSPFCFGKSKKRSESKQPQCASNTKINISNVRKVRFCTCSPSNELVKRTKRSTQESDLVCNISRTVFLDLSSLHKYWRAIPSNILFDSIIILPNIYFEWILKPLKFKSVLTKNTYNVLSDVIFSNFLQWKYEQRLLFCRLNLNETITSWNLPSFKHLTIAPFWQYISNQLSQLNDPLTYKTTYYKPLRFDFKWYSNKLLYRSKYGVTSFDIIRELASLNTQESKISKVVCEVLYQSNPCLNLVRSCSDIVETVLMGMNSPGSIDEPISPDIDIDFDGILDSIAHLLSDEDDEL